MKDRIRLIRKAAESIFRHTSDQALSDDLYDLANILDEESRWCFSFGGRRPIVAVDFDGVISEYKKGWTFPEKIDDGPVTGAIEWLNNATEDFDIVVFSARCNTQRGRVAILDWLCKNGVTNEAMDHIYIQPGKPKWHVIIDDRAIQFKGVWPSIEKVRKYKPWYYRLPGWGRIIPRDSR